jgi:hypothetical protein
MAYSVIVVPPGFGDGSGSGGGSGTGSGGDFTKPILEIAGAVTTPSYSFTVNQNSGMWSPSPTSLGLAVNGLPGLTLDSAGNASILKGASVGGPLLLQAQAGIYNGGAVDPNGVQTAAIGSLYLSSNGGTGSTVFYKRTGNDNQGWTPIGAPSTVSYPLLAPNGTAAANSYAFASSPGAGLFATGTNAIALGTSGNARLSIDANGLVSVGTLLSQAFTSVGTVQVGGNAHFSAQVSVDSSLSVGAGATVSGALSVGTNGSFGQNLSVTGTSTLTGALGLGGSLTLPSGVQVLSGTSQNPNGSVSAPIGSIYLAQSAAAQSSTLWLKEDTSTNGGWQAVATSGSMAYPIKAPDGVVSAPSYGFLSSQAGIYSPSVGAVALVTQGSNALVANADGSITVPGSASVLGSVVVTGGFDVTGGTQIRGGLTAHSGAAFVGDFLVSFGAGIQVTGNAALGGNLGVTGSSSLTGPLSAASTAAFSGLITLQSGATAQNGSLASPNAQVTASPGSIYLSGTGGTGQTIWVKENGVGNTGWTALAGPSVAPFPYLAPSGSAAQPSYSFADAPIGMYSPSTGVLAFATNSTKQLSIDAGGNVAIAGALGLLSSLSVASTLGVVGQSTLGATTVGGMLTATAGATFSGALVSIGSPLSVQGSAQFTTAQVTGALSAFSGLTVQSGVQLIAGGQVSPNNNVVAPEGSIYLSTSGGQGSTLYIKETGGITTPTSTGWTAFNAFAPPQIVYPITAPNGTVSAPSYGFASGSQGMFSPADGNLAFAAGGTGWITLSPTGATALLGTLTASGSVALSSTIGTFTVSPAATFNNSATFNGSVTFAAAGSVSFAAPVTLQSTLSVGGNTTLGGTLAVSGNSSFSVGTFSGALSAASLTVTGNTTTAALSVSGAAAFTGSVNVSNPLTIQAGVKVLAGSSANPNGAVTAPEGSIYLSTSGGSAFTLWVKEAGADNNGWVPASGAQSANISFPILATKSGTATAPVYSFSTATGTGVYLPSANALGLSTNGAAAVIFNSDQTATFQNSVMVNGGINSQAGSASTFNGDATFNGVNSFVGTATFNQGIIFPGQEMLFGGSQANPNGFVTASAGSLYLSSTGGLNKVLWVKETGTATNTGWVSYGNPATAAPPYPLLAPANESPSAPGYSFIGSTGTGLLSSAANTLQLATNGVVGLSIASDQTATFPSALTVTSGIISPAGSASSFNGTTSFGGATSFAQAISFPGQETVFGGAQATPNGFVTASAGSLYLSSTGGTNKSLWIKETGASSNTGWVSLSASPVFPLLAPANEAASAPGYSFSGSTGTGLLSTSANTLQLATGGVVALGLDASQNASLAAALSVTGTTTVQAGTLAALSLRFAGAATYGAYYDSTHTALALVAAGTQMLTVQNGFVGVGAVAPLSMLSVAGNLAVGSTVASGTAAPANGLLVQGQSIFQGNVTFQGTTTGVTAAPIYPLSAPTGTTASPNVPYAFTGNATTGLGYDTTAGALALYVGNSPVLNVIGSTVSLGGYLPPSPSALTALLINTPASVNRIIEFRNNAATGASLGFNNDPAGPLGLWLRANGTTDAISFTTANGVANAINFALRLASNTRAGFGSATAPGSQVSVFGNLSVGATSGATAAPTNGLLLQGDALLSGNLSVALNTTLVGPVSFNATGASGATQQYSGADIRSSGYLLTSVAGNASSHQLFSHSTNAYAGLSFMGNWGSTPALLGGGGFSNPNGNVNGFPGSIYLATSNAPWVNLGGAFGPNNWVQIATVNNSVSFPLLAPTGTTASPLVEFAFSGRATSGLGYDTTSGAVTLYSANAPTLNVVGNTVGLSGYAPPSSPNVALALNTPANTNLITLYLNAGADTGASIGWNNDSGAPLGMWFRGRGLGSTFLFTTANGTSGGTSTAVLIGTNTGTSFGTSAAAPTGGILVQGASTFTGNVTFNGGTTGVTATTTFPLNAPATQTATTPGYSITGSTTTGMYSPAVNTLAFTSNGVQALNFGTAQVATFSAQARAPSLGLGAATPTASQCYLLAAPNALTGAAQGTPSIQLAASAGLGAGYVLLDNTGAAQGQFGINLYTTDGVPQSVGLQSYGKPMLFQIGASYTNVAATGYNVAGSYFWGLGGNFQAASTLGVKGNLAVGTTVAAGTAAPANGLLVQGASILQGPVTLTAGLSDLTVTSTANNNLTLTCNASTTSQPTLTTVGTYSVASSYAKLWQWIMKQTNTSNGVTDSVYSLSLGAPTGVSPYVLSFDGIFGGTSNIFTVDVNNNKTNFTGSLSVGGTLASTPPTKGLLVTGLAQLTGGMTGAITPAVIAVPAATNVNPTTANSGSTYTFAGGGTLWLPAATAAAVGTVFTGVEIGTSSFQISDQNAGDVINYLGGQKAANSPYLATAQRGSSITVQCTAVNTWTVTSQLGSWS